MERCLVHVVRRVLLIQAARTHLEYNVVGRLLNHKQGLERIQEQYLIGGGEQLQHIVTIIIEILIGFSQEMYLQHILMNETYLICGLIH